MNKGAPDEPIGKETVISEDNLFHCTPTSCDPLCIEEWFDGNFSCGFGTDNKNLGPVDYRQQRPTKV